MLITIQDKTRVGTAAWNNMVRVLLRGGCLRPCGFHFSRNITTSEYEYSDIQRYFLPINKKGYSIQIGKTSSHIICNMMWCVMAVTIAQCDKLPYPHLKLVSTIHFPRGSSYSGINCCLGIHYLKKTSFLPKGLTPSRIHAGPLLRPTMPRTKIYERIRY